MCGIVGYVGSNGSCVRVLIDGLKRLEYRGYDSAGIARIVSDEVKLTKESGNLDNLVSNIDFSETSNLGIGHTRWATHGKADKVNAHPHKVGKFTLVHNGIIENYADIKNNLLLKGYTFKTQTDTEVLCALLDYLYKRNNNVLESISRLPLLVTGSYALCIICDDDKDNLYVAKNNSPLIIGVNEGENYVASDAQAFIDKTKKYVSLEDLDYGKISKDNVRIYHDGKNKTVQLKRFEFGLSDISKDNYEHYMLKEIYEEKEVFVRTTRPYLDNGITSLIDKMPDFSKYKKIRIIACGSATHAGLVGKQMLERYAEIKTEVETASEFRYNKVFLDKDELVIVISQSGETADTLEALKIANNNGNDTLGIINEKGSTIARLSKIVMYTEAGKEIAVATTKAYLAQVTMLSLIALNLSFKKDLLEKAVLKRVLSDAQLLTNYIQELFEKRQEYQKVADGLATHNGVFFIGRLTDYALAMEGSLKLKEISYTHSEAYPAGELKHGTISLIEDKTPVVALITDDVIASKTISNIKEVKARGAHVIVITNKDNLEDDVYDEIIKIPKVCDLFSPVLAVIPLQLIAYEVAKIKGCTIDKPKNLAKSVTVE